MTTDRFEELLKDLGRIVNLPLHPDKNGACKLNVNNVLQVQIECDRRKDRILIATFVCDMPPGKFRENILKEALKTNSLYPRIGTLAFSGRNNKLTLFDYLYFQELNADKLAKYLAKFIETADAWRVAVETGSPLPSPQTSKPTSGNLFGLKP